MRAFLFALLLVAAPALAQRGGVPADTPLRSVTRAAALVNARVVVAPGRVLERATVLIRDGRIEAVGRDLRVPADADVLVADSFTVYAGFVDALGIEGVPKPPERERFTGNRGDPPRERAGVTPERDVRETFDPTDGRVAALRALGFTAAHVAPRDGLLSGTGSVVLLRPPGRGEVARDVILTGPVSLVARLETASGVYPTTPMGVAAVFREAFENARRRGAQADGIARGGQRPRYDAALDALTPVVAGDRRLVLFAEEPLDAFRALGLARDVQVSPILAGLADAAPVASRLREARAVVFAPLALPDTVANDSLSRTITLPPSSGVSSVEYRRVRSFRDLPSDRGALVAERRAAVRRREASPAALAAAGVPFAFATLGAEPAKILPGLRRMVAAGLAPDAALEALTTAPARILGLSDDLGTVERGRYANLVVVRGDLFADSAAVRYVYVEGVRTENSAKPPRRPASGDSSDVEILGSWTLTVTTPGGDQQGAFTITGAPGSYAGSTTMEGGTYPLENVTLDESTLSFRFTAADFGTIEVSGTVSGLSFSGTAAVGPLGTFPATATRTPDGR